MLYFQKNKPIDIENYFKNTYGQILYYKEMYKIAQEKKPVRTHLLNFMVEGMIALNTAHYRAEDEKLEFWQKVLMDEELIFNNVVSKLYKIINGCTTEEWQRIMPIFFWEKQQEDQRRRLASSYYRTENCDSDSE